MLMGHEHPKCCRVAPFFTNATQYHSPAHKKAYGLTVLYHTSPPFSRQPFSFRDARERERESLAVQWGVAIEIERAIKKSASF